MDLLRPRVEDAPRAAPGIVAAPFLPSFAAGFTAGVQNFDPAFLAWNGVGTYTGSIYFFQISPSNLGFSGEMPLGLYNVNIFGPMPSRGSS